MKDKIFKYTFVIKDDEFANEVSLALMLLKKDYDKFYYRHIETQRNHLFEITTDSPDEKNFKHFLFRIGLKVEGGVKTRAR